MLAGLTAGAVVLALAFAGLPEICGGGRGGFLRWDPYRFHRSYRGAARFCLARRGMVYRPVMAVALGALAILALNKYDKTRAQRVAAKPEEEKTPVHAG